MSLKSAKQKAWAACSKYIRTKYAKNGIVECITCNVKKPIKEMQAGHFIDGRKNSILFDERGIHPQCPKCNIFNAGAKIEYYSFMLEKYGKEIVDELIKAKHKIVKYSEQDFKDIEKTFTEKLKELTNG